VYLAKLRLGDQVMLSPSAIQLLPPYLRMTYGCWVGGLDLLQLIPRAKYYRHRKALLGYGVNIAVPPQGEELPAIPLRQYLETPCIQVPAWAVGNGLYWQPGNDDKGVVAGQASITVRRESGVTRIERGPGPATPQPRAVGTSEDFVHAQAQFRHHNPLTSNVTHLPRGVDLERLESC